jgi:hypothetical protein
VTKEQERLLAEVRATMEAHQYAQQEVTRTEQEMWKAYYAAENAGCFPQYQQNRSVITKLRKDQL